MSFQALTWAIEQDVESPSARCVLMSIANYANENWCAWPKQELIAKEGVQSVDSVQRRMPDLISRRLLRRIKLKRFGRRTHDFYLLSPSPYFAASLEEIRGLFPAGVDVIDEAETDAAANYATANEAAADCGSDKNDSPSEPPKDSKNYAAADCGNAEKPTLPQSAVHATAIVRQPIDEPVKNQDSPPQTPPPRGGVENDDLWKRFDRFKAAYPIPIFNWDLTKREFERLSAADQELAEAGASSYGRECERANRRPKDAHKFLRDRMFVEFANRSKGAAATISFYAANSREARAITTLHAIARISVTEVGNEIAFSKPVTRQLLALADAPPQREWLRITNENQIAAWNGLLRESIVKARPMLAVNGSASVPWHWPPTKEGKINDDKTGPPADPLSDERVASLQKTG